MDRKVSVIEDLDGNEIVVIHDIRFKGKRMINWVEVEEYLKKFIGESYLITKSDDLIFILKRAEYSALNKICILYVGDECSIIPFF